MDHPTPISPLTKLGPGEEQPGQVAFPGRPSLGLGKGRGLQSLEGPRLGGGGGTGWEAGAGENPPGRHPEWLISADESLFSFRLNTLNRAPSDVYLHSLRANAGGGPRRRQGHAGAGGCRGVPGLLRGGDGGGGEERGVSPDPPLIKEGAPGPASLLETRREEQPWECFWTFLHQQSRQVGGPWGNPSLSYTGALDAAALCLTEAVISSFKDEDAGTLSVNTFSPTAEASSRAVLSPPQACLNVAPMGGGALPVLLSPCSLKSSERQLSWADI